MTCQLDLESTNLRARVSPSQGGRLTKLDWYNGDQWVPIMAPCTALVPGQWSHGGMPLLWPFPGRSWHEQHLAWHYAGTTFPMPIHGFSWQMPWEVMSASRDSAMLSLVATSETKQYYPFDFQLTLTILLREHHLALRLSVANREDDSAQVMPYSIGWHPYFALNHDEAFRLNGPLAAGYLVTADGRLGLKTDLLTQWPHPLHTSYLAKLDAHNKALVALRNTRYTVTFTGLEQMPWLVCWHDPALRAVCVEPWQSPPNAWSEHRESLTWLAPGTSEVHEFTIAITRD